MSAPEVKLSSRVQYIFDHRHDHYDQEETAKRDQYYYEAFQENPEEPRIIQFAKGFANTLQKKKILIKDYDILAGFSYRYTYEATMPICMSPEFNPRYRPSSSGDYEREIQDCIRVLGIDPQGEEARTLNFFAQAVHEWMYKHWESGHILPYYEKLLHVGYGGLLEEGRKALKTASGQQKTCINAMLICNEAAAQYILRYAARAEELAENSLEYRQNLKKMAKSLRQIAYGPAQTFFEAVQLLWLTHEMLFCESYPASFSFARIDQYLYPYYHRDLEDGTITREDAADIIDSLWIKFSTTLHTYQNLTLGGWNYEANTTACNDITVLALQASRKCRFEQPQVCFRYHKDLPDEIWEECYALLKTGTGFPAFFSDKGCIENKMRLGIPQKDAENFGLIGCVEMGVPGKEYGKTEVLRINWAKILELMLHKGNCTITGTHYPLQEEKDLSAIQSFHEFYQWYQRELIHFSKLAADSVNMLDRALPHCYPTPYLSTLMEGCYQKGMDVTAGGTIYNNTGINACGMANVADSLAAIRKLVFLDRKYTLQDFANACAANFAGYEQLYHDILYACPKYGNDEDSVDLLLTDLIHKYGDFVATLRNPRGGRFQLGLYSVEDHAYMGEKTGALPDGKFAGISLSNGLSPVQGRDTLGPTAVINSVLKINLNAATNGMVLDVKFTPTFLKSNTHKNAIHALLDTYFGEGGIEIQFNVVDRETLLAAQLHPENYQDLVVRVSGFSALFVTLMKTTQDEIIARTEYQSV